MPESVSISKQALGRGYALLAISSFNRSVGSGSRCWRWVLPRRLLSRVCSCGTGCHTKSTPNLAQFGRWAAVMLTWRSRVTPPCSWHTDAKPVQAIVEGFVKEFQLEGLPLFFTGCSCEAGLLRVLWVMCMP
jgi:hypothetical protein